MLDTLFRNGLFYFVDDETLMQKFKSFLHLSRTCFFHHSSRIFLPWNSFTARVVLLFVWWIFLHTKNSIDMWQQLVSGFLSHTPLRVTGTTLKAPEAEKGLSPCFSVVVPYKQTIFSDTLNLCRPMMKITSMLWILLNTIWTSGKCLRAPSIDAIL